jgi:hypothetical protein
MFSSTSDSSRHVNWTVIVVTAPDRESAYAFDFGAYRSMKKAVF